jgi:uncharacterized peroxidase-related enzyme
MAWIRIIRESEATGKLKKMYDKLIEPWGGVDNIMKIHSLNPRSLWAHFEFYAAVMRGKSDLSRAQREMIAVVVSSINQCHYRITHHGAGLRRLTGDEALVAQLISDYREAALSPADRAMLDYAVKLTLEPWNMVEEDVQALRAAGFSDAAILDINQVTGYYAFVNRLADGLGVELEDFWDKA